MAKILPPYTELTTEMKADRLSPGSFLETITNVPVTICRRALDDNLTVHFLSPAFETLSGYSVDHFSLQGTKSFRDIVHPEDLQRVTTTLQDLFEEYNDYRIEYRLCCENGAIKWVGERGTFIFDRFKEIACVDSVIFDINDRKELELQFAKINRSLSQAKDVLFRQALHDPLTGLGNYRLLTDRLQHAIDIARRENKKIALIWIDLDFFKKVNDHFGHQAGNTVLMEVGRRLSSCTRASDTVARMGGDEFVVLMETDVSLEGTKKLAERCVEVIVVPIAVGDKTCKVGASAGFALLPDHATNADELLQRADHAMYQVKEMRHTRAPVGIEKGAN
jgi:diguanylate cyclase (GGDEF)-like protein/PAS domain S-box-containing protein